MLAGNLSSSRDDESTSRQGLLYAPSGGLGTRLASTTPDDAAASLASGSYNPAPVDVVASSGSFVAPSAAFAAAPVSAGPGPMTTAEVTQAFGEAFGTLSAAEIAADDLAPIVGAMEATDVMAVGSQGAQTEFTDFPAPGPPEVHASEPATLILLGSGLLALARRQRSKNATREPLP